MSDLQLDHICTYKLITEDGEDETGLREMLYKYQLLQIFNMCDFNEKELNTKIENVYEIIKNEEFIKKIFANHPYKGILENELIFRTLFSYDYLDLFHKCLYYYFNNQSLDSSLTQLMEKLC